MFHAELHYALDISKSYPSAATQTRDIVVIHIVLEQAGAWLWTERCNSLCLAGAGGPVQEGVRLLTCLYLNPVSSVGLALTNKSALTLLHCQSSVNLNRIKHMQL